MTDKPKETGNRAGLVFPYPDDDNFFDEGIPKGVLSPSGFGMYMRCPKQFEYAYVMGKRRPPGFSMIRGVAIHKGAEVVHKHTIKTGTPLSMEAAVQSVSDDWDEGQEQVEDWKDNDGNVVKPGAVKDSAIANFRTYYVQAVPLIRPVAAEKPFAMKVGTVPMRGVIDLIDQIPGEYDLHDDPDQPPPLVEVVSDLKTTKKKWAPQKLEQDNQLTVYALVENTDRVRVDLLLDLKSGSKYVPMRAIRNYNAKRLLIEDVESAVHYMKQGVFPRCDPTAWNCTPRFCGFYGQCRGPK